MGHPNAVGEFIRKRREWMGFSLRELAQKAEISYSQLSRIERGLSEPSKDTLAKISYALNVSKEEIFALAGILDDDIKEEFASNIRVIYDLLPQINTASVVAESVAATYNVDSITEVFYNVLKKRHPKFDEDDLNYLAKEITSAYYLSLRRLETHKKLTY